MSDEKRFHVFKIVRRPWYEWVMIGLWIFAEVMFLQAALASRQELEPRAAIVYWLVFIVLLLGGLVYWIVRRKGLE
jgi:FtsH-binding integral membrane protein